MPDTKRRKLHYKRAIFNRTPEETLEQMVRTAVDRRRTALGRAYRPTDEVERFHFLNYHLTHGIPRSTGSIYGIELVAYEIGHDPGALLLDESATEVPIERLLEDSDERQAIQGLLYVGFAGDHVIVLQSLALRFPHLERYLNWLLRDTEVFAEGQSVGLGDPLPQRFRRQTPATRGIVIKDTIGFSATPLRSSDDQEVVKGITLRPAGRSFRALREMLGDLMDLPREFDEAELENAPVIDMEIRLQWKRPPREGRSEFLQQLQFKLRNVDEEFDYKVLTDEGELSKDEFKLYDDTSILWGRVRPAADDLFPKMLRYLTLLAQRGKVEW